MEHISLHRKREFVNMMELNILNGEITLDFPGYEGSYKGKREAGRSESEEM